MNKRKLFSIIVSIQVSILLYPWLKSVSNVFSEVYAVSDVLFVSLALLVFVVVPGLIFASSFSLGEEGFKRILYAIPLGLLFLYTSLFVWELFVPTFSDYRPLGHTSLVVYTVVSFVITDVVFYVHKESRNWGVEYGEFEFTPLVKLSVIVLILGFAGWWWLLKFDNDIVTKSLLVVVVLIPLYIVWADDRQLGVLVLLGSTMFALVISSELLFQISGSFVIPYNFISDVMANENWILSIPHKHNNILSTMLVIPFLSKLLRVPIKSSLFFYYLIYATLPIYSYIVATELEIQQTYSFLGAYLIFTFPMVTYNFGGIIRQLTSLAFLSAFLLVIVDAALSRRKTYTLASGFLIGITLSHYATIYLVLAALTVAVLYYFVVSLLQPQNRNGVRTNLLLVLLIGSVFTLSWQIYVSSGTLMVRVATIVELIVSNLSNILETQTQGEQYAFGTRTLPFVMFRILNVIVVSIVVISGLSMFKSDLTSNSRTGRILCVGICSGFGLLLGLSVIVPYFAGYTSIDFPRLYAISLFVFAPVFSHGLLTVKDYLSTQNRVKVFNVVIAVFLMITMLFGSGLIFEYTQNTPNPATHLMTDNEELSVQEEIRVYSEFFTQRDVSGATFLSTYGTESIRIYSDWYSGSALLVSFGGFDSRWIPSEEKESWVLEEPTTVPPNSYVFLSAYNTENGALLNRVPEHPTAIREYLPEINRYNKIYSNNGTSIRYH